MGDPHEAMRLAVEGVAADEDEIVVGWALVAEVSRPDGGRHLAHRAGGVGDSMPYVWTVLGMLRAGVLCAEEQMVRQDPGGA